MAKRHHFNKNICASSNLKSEAKRNCIISNYNLQKIAEEMTIPKKLQKQTVYKIEVIATLS